MSEDSKFKFASAALHAVAPRDLGLAGSMLANLGGTGRNDWRRVYEAAHRGGIGDLPAAPLADQRPWLEAFFLSVLEQTVDCSELPQVGTEAHPTLMLNPRTLDFPELVERIQKYFCLPKASRYKGLSNVRSTALGRPAEQYAFAHVGDLRCGMPGISYNNAKEDKLCFLDETEYMLASAYNKWRNGSWFDVSGWTRLDALWPDGGDVGVSWDDGRLFWGWNDRSDGRPYGGPRSAIIL